METREVLSVQLRLCDPTDAIVSHACHLLLIHFSKFAVKFKKLHLRVDPFMKISSKPPVLYSPSLLHQRGHSLVLEVIEGTGGVPTRSSKKSALNCAPRRRQSHLCSHPRLDLPHECFLEDFCPNRFLLLFVRDVAVLLLDFADDLREDAPRCLCDLREDLLENLLRDGAVDEFSHRVIFSPSEFVHFEEHRALFRALIPVSVGVAMPMRV
mmetsp:Transcript_43653/g.86105  ORF Transcript_43653/g.86105 Transcript_43653/m.86105 type:complete len:211 (+) Transcript_43653:807-1439(+)